MKSLLKIFTIFALLFVSGEAFAKSKKQATAPKKKIEKALKTPQVIAIPQNYFLQADLDSKLCDKLTGDECFRRDGMRDKPYFHETTITIFEGKVFAQQIFHDEEEPGNLLYVKLRDGLWEVETKRRNRISFVSKGGKVSDLKLLKGDFKIENDEPQPCEVALAVLGFARAYDPQLIVAKSRFFKDESDFDGLKEVLIFSEKNVEGAPLFALIKNSKKNYSPIFSLNLCKREDFENLLQRVISRDQCYLNLEDDAPECAKYQACHDYISIRSCNVTFLAQRLF
jgi:hypothetical protein